MLSLHGLSNSLWLRSFLHFTRRKLRHNSVLFAVTQFARDRSLNTGCLTPASLRCSCLHSPCIHTPTRSVWASSALCDPHSLLWVAAQVLLSHFMVDNTEAQKLEDIHLLLRLLSGGPGTSDRYVEFTAVMTDLEERKVVLSLEFSN